MEEEEEIGNVLTVLTCTSPSKMALIRLFFSHLKASDMINSILEGYPKSKKEFLVSEKVMFYICHCLVLKYLKSGSVFFRMKSVWRQMKIIKLLSLMFKKYDEMFKATLRFWP